MTLGDTPRPRLPPREKTEAEKKKTIEVDHRCLLLASVMLERVNTVSRWLEIPNCNTYSTSDI